MSLQQVKADVLLISRHTRELYKVISEAMPSYTRKGVDKWLQSHLQTALDVKYGTETSADGSRKWGNASIYLSKDDYSVKLDITGPKVEGIETKDLLEYGRIKLHFYFSCWKDSGQTVTADDFRVHLQQDIVNRNHSAAEIEAWDVDQAEKDIAAYKAAEIVYNAIPYQLRKYGGL